MSITSKVCFKCLKELPITEFYKHSRMADGHLGKCRSCTKRDVVENYALRRDEKHAYDKMRFQTPERKAYQVEQQRKYRARHPQKFVAHQAVGKAIQSGRLIRGPCEVCGVTEKVQGHHDDYSKPLVVRWLCFRCHRKHGHNQHPTRIMPINLKLIPTELQARPQWCLWFASGVEKTKVPLIPGNGDAARTNDPATWRTFNEMAKHATEIYQPGFVFSEADPFTGIDLDGCRNPVTGELAAWAREIVLSLNSYAELSPSETGGKLFVKATVGKGRMLKLPEMPKVSDKTPGIEMYDRLRYFAVTGRRMGGQPHEPQERQSVVDALLSRFWPSLAVPTPTRPIDAVERARRYLAKMAGAVSGQGGHPRTFYAACILVLGFDLPEETAMELLREWNQGCQPPWAEWELRHKITSAMAETDERGYLLERRDMPRTELLSGLEREFKKFLEAMKC